MILILTLIATNKIVQVSDRRLTLDGETCDTNANKLVCVGCDDARFSVGYTGVAEIGGQRTDYWLVDQISSIFSSGHTDVLTVYKGLADRATSAVSRAFVMVIGPAVCSHGARSSLWHREHSPRIALRPSPL